MCCSGTSGAGPGGASGPGGSTRRGTTRSIPGRSTSGCGASTGCGGRWPRRCGRCRREDGRPKPPGSSAASPLRSGRRSPWGSGWTDTPGRCGSWEGSRKRRSVCSSGTWPWRRWSSARGCWETAPWIPRSSPGSSSCCCPSMMWAPSPWRWIASPPETLTVCAAARCGICWCWGPRTSDCPGSTARGAFSPTASGRRCAPSRWRWRTGMTG